MITRVPVALGFFALLAAGCGSGAATPAKSPTDAPAAAPTVAGQATPGQPLGMSDAPTSGEAGQERPKMSATAASAYSAGMTAFQNGDLQGAKTQFTQAAQADQKAFQAFYSLGVVKERLGDTPGALAAYRQATLVVSDYEPAIVAYAVLLARSGRADEAVEYVNGRLTAMPKSAAVSGAMAEIKSIQGDSGAAQRFAQEALKKNPDYRPAMVTIARDHYRARKMDLAKYAIQAILEGFGEASPARDRENAEAHLLRGLIYRETGARAVALADFEAAVKKRPDLVEALLNLGSMRLEAGNAQDALPVLESATRFSPNNAVAHLNLGDAYRLLGRYADARKEFDRALSIDSALAAAHYDMGLMYLTAPSIPGTSADQQVATAIKELETYKTMRGPKAPPGVSDDIDDLLNRAKAKQAELKNAAAVAAPAAAAPAAKPDAGAAPAKK